MPSRGSRRLLAVLLGPVVLLGAASCADDDPSSAPGGDPTAVVATERALAAAVETHLGREAVAAAPLFRGDGLPRGAVGVELSFDRPVGDHTHVRVVVSPPGADPDAKQLRTCRGTPTTWECEQDVVGATSYVLLREAGYAGEDPGLVGAVGRRDGSWCWPPPTAPSCRPPAARARPRPMTWRRARSSPTCCARWSSTAKGSTSWPSSSLLLLMMMMMMVPVS